MSLRVLSGLILPSDGFTEAGSAVIDFVPHTISGDVKQPSNEHKEGVGLNLPFTSEPCKVIALRKLEFHDTDTTHIGQGGGGHTERWDINDEFLPNNDEGGVKSGLRVSWNTDGSAKVLEIAYLIIGEVAG